jgi:hypothetical protein
MNSTAKSSVAYLVWLPPLSFFLLGCDQGQGSAANSVVPAATAVPSVPPIPGAEVVSTAHSKPTDGWKEYSYPEAGFKIRFPAEPKVPDLASPLYVAGDVQVNCTVRIETPEPGKFDERMKQIMNEISRFSETPPKEVTLSGRPALELEAESPPGANYKKPPPVRVMRLLKTDSEIFVVLISGRPERVSRQMLTEFFDSFTLIK